MIWFRRGAAILLMLPVIVLFIAALVVTRVNDTAGNPGFYTDQLRKADVYNFLYDDVLPAALNENGDALPEELKQFQPQIIELARETLPPDWLQAQVEQAINQALPYLLGDEDTFRIDVTLKDRVLAAAAAARSMLHGPDVFPRVYDDLVDEVVDQAMANMQGVAPAFSLDRAELDSMVRTVVPPEWLLLQIDDAIDQIVPYLTEDRDSFTIHVSIADRMDALETTVATLLNRQQTYDYVYESILVPAIRQNIEASVELSVPGLIVPGLILTDFDILQAVQQALPQEWYQARVTDLVGQTFAYLEGRQQALDIAIPLADRKPAVTEALLALADQKLRALGVSVEQLRLMFGVDLKAMLEPLVDSWVPDQWSFTDADLRSALGSAGGGDIIDQTRDWVRNGVSFSDQDLRSELGSDFSTVEDIRTRIAAGFTVTEVDLRDAIRGEDGQGERGLSDLENARSWLGSLRGLKLVFWIAPVLMLVGIGFLGGRRWSTRLIWGAAPLAVAGLVALTAAGFILGPVDEALSQAAQGPSGVELLAAEMGVEIGRNAVGDFVGGLRVQSAIMFVIGLAAVAGGAVWYWREREREDRMRATDAS